MRRFIALILTVALLSCPVRGAGGTKYVALTFDDGPSGKYTQRLLEGLQARNVRATFFLCGYRLEDYGELAREIRRRGHEIGLHGYSHDSMPNMSEEQLRRELTDTLALLPEGCLVNLMRPPGGATGQVVSRVSGQMNLSIIDWSVDPKDWATRDRDLILDRLLSMTGDGDVILLHDMTDSSVDAALALVDELKAQGYRFLTVSQLAMLRLRQLKPGASYSAFPPQ
ncbi:MAG: polysaccharide deacetylase family protein [Oscillospiraceae bacterium]|nr:polysaccharide deacetylase family protein [Oscillospiraceae bacterium]